MLAALGAGAGGLLLSRLRQARPLADVPVDPAPRRAPHYRGAAAGHRRATRWRREYRAARHVAGVPHQRQRHAELARISGACCGEHFADWRLVVDGLVARPLALSLEQIGALPRAPRSPATIASRDGARSASGPGAAAAADAATRAGLRAAGALHRLPLRRRFRRHALIMKASTSSTPSTRRPSSPGR